MGPRALLAPQPGLVRFLDKCLKCAPVSRRSGPVNRPRIDCNHMALKRRKGKLNYVLGNPVAVATIISRSLFAPRAGVFRSHLALLRRSSHEPSLSLFAIFARCRLILQIVDHVIGHSGGLFSASAGFASFRSSCAAVQARFREAANCLGTAHWLLLIG